MVSEVGEEGGEDGFTGRGITMDFWDMGVCGILAYR